MPGPLHKYLAPTVVAAALSISLTLVSLAVVAVPAHAQDPVDVAALGDSITNGASMSGTLGNGVNDSTANWSTGTQSSVYSHYRHIKIDLGLSVGEINRVAKSGSTSNDLYRQAGYVSSITDYATILSGGNDICGSSTLTALPSKASYKANVLSAVDRLQSENARMVIALVSVPSMKKLYSVGITSADGRAAYDSGVVCRIALGTYSGETVAAAQARRDAVDARIRDYNSALSEIAAIDSKVFYDNGAAYSAPFALADISPADFFHPSYTGQDLLATRTWDAFDAQKAFATLPGAGASSPAPPVLPTVSPKSQVVRGAAYAQFTITSDSSISSASLYVPGLGATLSLTRHDGSNWRSATKDTRLFPNGTYPATVTARDADGDLRQQGVTFTIDN